MDKYIDFSSVKNYWFKNIHHKWYVWAIIFCVMFSPILFFIKYSINKEIKEIKEARVEKLEREKELADLDQKHESLDQKHESIESSKDISLSNDIVKNLFAIWDNPKNVKSVKSPYSTLEEDCNIYEIKNISEVQYCENGFDNPRKSLHFRDNNHIFIETILGQSINKTESFHMKGLRFFEFTSGSFSGYSLRIDSSNKEYVEYSISANDEQILNNKNYSQKQFLCYKAYEKCELRCKDLEVKRDNFKKNLSLDERAKLLANFSSPSSAYRKACIAVNKCRGFGFGSKNDGKSSCKANLNSCLIKARNIR